MVDLLGNRQLLPLAPRPMNWASLSPAGESLVFVSESQVYLYDVIRNTAPRQLTFEGSSNVPVFSPDGTQVVFGSLRPGTTDGWDLFVKNLMDDAPPRSLVTLGSNQYPTHWVDDDLIVFTTGGPPFDAWTLDLSDPDAPEARPYLTPEADLRPVVVSPDGTLAAYSSNETGSYQVYLRSFPNPGVQTVVSDAQGQAEPNRVWWAPDGNTLYYWVGVSGNRTILAARLQREPVPTVLATDTLFTVPAVYSTTHALYPEGDRFIFMVADGESEAPTAVEDGDPSRLILVQNFFEELRQRVGN